VPSSGPLSSPDPSPASRVSPSVHPRPKYLCPLSLSLLCLQSRFFFVQYGAHDVIFDLCFFRSLCSGPRSIETKGLKPLSYCPDCEFFLLFAQHGLFGTGFPFFPLLLGQGRLGPKGWPFSELGVFDAWPCTKPFADRFWLAFRRSTGSFLTFPPALMELNFRQPLCYFDLFGLARSRVYPRQVRGRLFYPLPCFPSFGSHPVAPGVVECLKTVFKNSLYPDPLFS